MTIKDIAKLAGVGVGTVSRVLNNHPDVTDKTREKVLQVIRENNYQPNSNAKHLKQQHSSSIAIIVKGTNNMLFADLVEQIQALLLKNGEESGVYYLDEEANEVAYALRLCRERHPKGILFLGGNLEYFQESFGAIQVPCVLMTNTAKELGFANLSSVTTDDVEASARAIDLLIREGHEKIGVLGGKVSCMQISYYRLRGCQECFHRHGRSFDVIRHYEACRFSFQGGYDAAARLLERDPELTAIFATSDMMAVGVIRALQDMGKRVPEDISVVGYDGISVGQFVFPRLATIQQDTHQMALRGTEILLRSIERKTRAIHEVIPFQLLAGESVARVTEG